MRRVPTCNRVLQAYVPLVAIVFLALPGSLQASILLPEKGPFNLEEMLAQRDAAVASSSTPEASRRSATTPRGKMPPGIPPTGPKGPGEWLFTFSSAQALPTTGGGSNPGTSTSGGGTSGTSLYPIDSTAATSLLAIDLVRWVSGEQRISLPMPPGTDLLRPPQFG